MQGQLVSFSLLLDISSKLSLNETPVVVLFLLLSILLCRVVRLEPLSAAQANSTSKLVLSALWGEQVWVVLISLYLAYSQTSCSCIPTRTNRPVTSTRSSHARPQMFTFTYTRAAGQLNLSPVEIAKAESLRPWPALSYLFLQKFDFVDWTSTGVAQPEH
ncbi:hypothetical protein DFS33DRAFT_863519 [Desarmillaria ectypa]|nr:hypothetical protein DFS33DRAFT_863519 [Desarmillaria ectypa]